MKIKDIAQAIEQIVPLGLAQDWDNVGLLIGNPAKNIKNILLTIDTTQAVVAEAKAQKADLILAYHPIIWDGLKRVTSDGETAHIYDLVKSGISVFCIHTALDVAAGGVNDLLADILGIENAKPIGDYVANPAGPQYKVITFVPQDDVNKVANALYEAGAGAIGNYSHCGFQSDGTGTFKPLAGSNPTIGKRGKLETVNEIKLETVVPSAKVAAVIAALRQSHPYETPAFDVFKHCDIENKIGLGRIGNLKQPLSMQKAIANIKSATGCKAVGIVGPQRRTVKKAAVCAGSCGKILNSVIAQGADLYLTGELKHHQALAAQEAGLTCICLSHTVSERFALKNLAKQLKKRLKNVTIRISKKDKDPFKWVTVYRKQSMTPDEKMDTDIEQAKTPQPCDSEPAVEAEVTDNTDWDDTSTPAENDEVSADAANDVVETEPEPTAETEPGKPDIEDNEDDAEEQETETPADFEATLETVIEAVLFASDEPLSPKRLVDIAEAGSVKDVNQCVKALNKSYRDSGRSFRIEKISGGYQMMTLSVFNSWISKLIKVRSDNKLTPAGLEALAIVAYKQPIIRADVEAIRGVASGEILRNLMYKGMVKIVGRAEVIGRPMLYGTTKKFLDVFGLNTLKDLPKIEELKAPQ